MKFLLFLILFSRQYCQICCTPFNCFCFFQNISRIGLYLTGTSFPTVQCFCTTFSCSGIYSKMDLLLPTNQNMVPARPLLELLWDNGASKKSNIFPSSALIESEMVPQLLLLLLHRRFEKWKCWKESEGKKALFLFMWWALSRTSGPYHYGSVPALLNGRRPAQKTNLIHFALFVQVEFGMNVGKFRFEVFRRESFNGLSSTLAFFEQSLVSLGRSSQEKFPFFWTLSAGGWGACLLMSDTLFVDKKWHLLPNLTGFLAWHLAASAPS